MKKIFVLAAVATAFTMASCGSTKSVVVSNPTTPQWTSQSTSSSKPQRQLVEISDVERMSFDVSDGKLRAFASAQDPDRDFARQQAVASAKAQLASDMKALLTNILDIYRGTTKKNNLSTSERDSEQKIEMIAEEYVTNCSVIGSQLYMIGDVYEYEVCVAQIGTIDEAAEKLVLSEDAVLGVRFNEQQFCESKAAALERYRQEKANH